jgi:DnaJ-class molecular chaperone
MAEPEKKYEPALCAGCEGYGCVNCRGTGTVLVEAPKRKCPHCDGAGCIYCGFTGWHHPKGKYD